jgi:hypothetical protein
MNSIPPDTLGIVLVTFTSSKRLRQKRDRMSLAPPRHCSLNRRAQMSRVRGREHDHELLANVHQCVYPDHYVRFTPLYLGCVHMYWDDNLGWQSRSEVTRAHMLFSSLQPHSYHSLSWAALLHCTRDAPSVHIDVEGVHATHGYLVFPCTLNSGHQLSTLDRHSQPPNKAPLVKQPILPARPQARNYLTVKSHATWSTVTSN